MHACERYILVQSAGAIVYADCIFAEGENTLPTKSILDMTLKYLIVIF